MATYYVDFTGGNDSKDGLAQTISGGAGPWKTISKVNGASFSAGDSILFKKGETWREVLTLPSSGVNGNPIIYGSYGSGAQPIITGSDNVLGVSGDWADQGGNVWRKNIGATAPTIAVFDATHIGVIDATPDTQYEWTYTNPNLDVYYLGNPTSYYSAIEVGVRTRGLQTNNQIVGDYRWSEPQGSQHDR